MKQFLLPCILLIALSCQSEVQRRLDCAESLLQQQPDSALYILQSIENSQLQTTRKEARYALLMSAALDKNYIDVSSDSLIHKAVEYYSRHGDTRHKMLAYYYHGRVLYNGKQHPSAIIALEKAEKEAKAINDAYQLGLIYRNKANVFSEFNNNPEAIICQRKAVECFKEAKTTLYQTYAEYSLAIDYINNKEFEIADSLLTVVLEKSNANPGLIHQSRIRKATILVHKGIDSEKAIESFQKTPKRYYSFIDYSICALAYEKLGQKDSADYWLYKGYSLCHDQADSATLDYMKAKIALRRGQYEEAYHLIDHAVSVQDSVTRILLQQSVNAAQRDYYKAETARQEDQLKATRIEKAMGWAIGILFSLTCVLYFWTLAKEKDRLLQEQIANLSLAKIDYDRINKENAHLLGSLLSSRISHLDDLATTYFKTEDQQEKDKAFKQIKQSVSSLRNNPEVFRSLEEDLDTYCNGIISKLRKQVPRIKGRNFNLITLFFAGFSYDVVWLLMGSASIDSLKMARSRFRKEILAADAPDKDIFLKMLEMK